jgi:hypothetical protein
VDEEIVTLASYSDPFEAEYAKERLEEAGFRVFQSGDVTNSLFAGLGGAFAKIQLHVFASDQERALTLLAGLHREDSEGGDEQPSTTAVTAGNYNEERAPETALREAATGEATKPPSSGPGDTIQTRPSFAKQDINADDDGEDEDRFYITRGPDDLARRAWLSAVFGLMLQGAFLIGPLYLLVTVTNPFLLYSAFLLLRLMMNSEKELSRKGTRHLYGAVAVLGLVGILFCANMLFFSRWHR